MYVHCRLGTTVRSQATSWHPFIDDDIDTSKISNFVLWPFEKKKGLSHSFAIGEIHMTVVSDWHFK